MKNLIPLSLFFMLSSCGIEVPQPIPRLFPPNGVLALNALETGVPATIRVTWVGLNPELEFSGYNIYYTDNIADATALRGTRLLNPTFNPIQPTLIVNRPFNVAQNFSFDINRNYCVSKPPLFSQGKTYYFFVKAFNQLRNIESPASLSASVIYEENTTP